MSQPFADRVALITGAGSGIGRAACLSFARQGARVAVSDYREDIGQETVALIRELGGDAAFFIADMRSMSDIDAMVEGAAAHFGRLDFAFNNAGHPGMGTDVVACSEDEWDMIMTVNVKAVWRCMQRQIPHMLKIGGGAIVNTSSGLGLQAAPNTVSYVTSKHAVVGLTRSVALDYAPHNIRANVLHPGPTETPTLAMATANRGVLPQDLAPGVPMKRLGTSEEQGDAAVFLCSDQAAFITGASLVVDGGVTIRR